MKHKFLLMLGVCMLGIACVGCSNKNKESDEPSTTLEQEVSENSNEKTEENVEEQEAVIETEDEKGETQATVEDDESSETVETETAEKEEPSNGDKMTITHKETRSLYESLNPEYEFGDFMWNKKYVQFTSKSIKLDQNWSAHISIDGVKIDSTKFTDISTLNNYFYKENSSAQDLERCYYNDVYEIIKTTKKTVVGKNSSFQTQFKAMSYGNNVILRDIQLVGISNVYQDNGKELIGIANYKDGVFGFGSTHSNVVNIIGKANESITDKSGMIDIITDLYTSENVEMVLTYCMNKNDKIENAVLTSINWRPIKISATLQNQPNIQLFEGYRTTDTP